MVHVEMSTAMSTEPSFPPPPPPRRIGRVGWGRRQEYKQRLEFTIVLIGKLPSEAVYGVGTVVEIRGITNGPVKVGFETAVKRVKGAEWSAFESTSARLD